ncbi:MAG TPA: DUF1684 domain-containing protein [Methylomirabilota bacterium]|nr:DUF1684 domain-containing protein [Methylomirabilota bacterium]
MRPTTVCAVLALLVTVTACGPAPVEVPETYREQVKAAWAAREARLLADDGWLSVVGLHWLEPGVHTIGSAPEAGIRLPEGAPPVVGALELLGDGTVRFSAEDRADITVNGGPAGVGPLASDADGAPDVVAAGRVSFYLIERAGRVGVRVKDPRAPARQAFDGLDHFPIDPSYRVVATLDPYAEPREVEIPTVLGTPTVMIGPGVLRFAIHGHDVFLEPYLESPDSTELFIIFRDATAGHTTYGGGRYLSADLVPGSTEVVLDFNLATNPPCAFTPHATCPLPTPENTLAVAVEAGEKYSGEGH